MSQQKYDYELTVKGLDEKQSNYLEKLNEYDKKYSNQEITESQRKEMEELDKELNEIIDMKTQLVKEIKKQIEMSKIFNEIKKPTKDKSLILNEKKKQLEQQLKSISSNIFTEGSNFDFYKEYILIRDLLNKRMNEFENCFTKKILFAERHLSSLEVFLQKELFCSIVNLTGLNKFKQTMNDNFATLLNEYSKEIFKSKTMISFKQFLINNQQKYSNILKIENDKIEILLRPQFKHVEVNENKEFILADDK